MEITTPAKSGDRDIEERGRAYYAPLDTPALVDIRTKQNRAGLSISKRSHIRRWRLSRGYSDVDGSRTMAGS
jgi:hypothetical protein